MLPIWAWVDLCAMVMKGYSTFPKVPALLEPHEQIVQCHIKDICWGGVFLPLSRDAVGVFYSPSQADWDSITRASRTGFFVSYQGHSLMWGGDLILCRDAVGVFNSPSRLGYYHLVYSDYCLHLNCYIHSFSADAFFDYFHVFQIALGKLFIWSTG